MYNNEICRKENEKIREWAIRINGTRNIRRVKCIGKKLQDNTIITCNHSLEAGQGYAVVMPEAGLYPRYYCEECMNRTVGYHTNKMIQRNGIGTPKSGDIESTTIGVELEYVNVDRNNRYAEATFKAIIENRLNVVRENDCTVTGEFPTDYFYGLNIISKTIRKLLKYGFTPYFNNERCGAHIHVEVKNMDIIRNWYHTLFMPLYEYISSHSDEWIINNFGRSFGEWACRIDYNSNVINHSNFINTQHNNTLEFRLPRITSEQYIEVIKFWREIGYTLNSIEWMPSNIERSLRKKQAVEASEAILKIARKYFD